MYRNRSNFIEMYRNRSKNFITWWEQLVRVCYDKTKADCMYKRKRKISASREFDLNYETVDPDHKIGHLFIGAIKFDLENAAPT